MTIRTHATANVDACPHCREVHWAAALKEAPIEKGRALGSSDNVAIPFSLCGPPIAGAAPTKGRNGQDAPFSATGKAAAPACDHDAARGGAKRHRYPSGSVGSGLPIISFHRE